MGERRSTNSVELRERCGVGYGTSQAFTASMAPTSDRSSRGSSRQQSFRSAAVTNVGGEAAFPPPPQQQPAQRERSRGSLPPHERRRGR